MTAAQRRAINRYNARKSTGPITPEGLERTRNNALKHGLRALDYILPGDDPAALQQEFDDQIAHYQPVGHEEFALVEDIIVNVLKLRRCAHRDTAVVASQMRAAKEIWHCEQKDRLADLKTLLLTDPATAVRELKRFGPGRRWMIDRWRFLSYWFQKDGYSPAPGLTDEAIRLMGVDPNRLKAGTLDAYKFRLFSALLRPDSNPAYVPFLLSPAIMHDDYCADYGDCDLPDPEYCRSEVARIVLHEINEVESDEQDAVPDERADETSRGLLAMIPAATADARLALRYESMARSARDKARKELARLQDERYAVEALADAEADVITIADAPPSVAPNEANTPQESPPSVEPATSCDPSTSTNSAEPMNDPVGVEEFATAVAFTPSSMIAPNSPVVTTVMATSPPA